MTVQHGPGITYWGDTATGQWVPIGAVTCSACHGTGYDDTGLACLFGCGTTPASLRRAADLIEHDAPGWARRMRQEADHIDAQGTLTGTNADIALGAPGRDALRDVYEEALDLAMYLRQAIEERDHPTVSQLDGEPGGLGCSAPDRHAT